MKLILAILLTAVLLGAQVKSPPGLVSQNTGGVCSQAVVAGGNVTITCQGLDSEQRESLKKLPTILGQLLKKGQADRDAILTKLDELLRGVGEIRKQGPRKLDERMMAQIISKTSMYADQEIDIRTQISDGEATSLAQQLKETLERAEWKVAFVPGMLLTEKPVFGIQVFVAAQTPSALALLNALHATGLAVEGLLNPQLKNDKIQMVVWPKPQ